MDVILLGLDVRLEVSGFCSLSPNDLLLSYLLRGREGGVELGFLGLLRVCLGLRGVRSVNSDSVTNFGLGLNLVHPSELL